MSDEAQALAPFRSNAEMTAAIQDPRYAKDEAYRQDVADRITAGSAAPTPHNATTPGEAPAASPFYEVTGGRAQFLEARHRLTQQATAADRQRWNDAIDSGDTATIRGLIAAYQAPAAPSGTSAPSRATTGGFGSKAEMFAAMRDPRYAKDEAYRQTVMDRMAKAGETQRSNTRAAPFQSNAEMVKAIQDPRYAKDEAYRQDVAARIAAKA